MIIGMGIDAVEIERFAHWHQLNDKQLSRIFSEHEIKYCLSVPNKTAERLAVRFAAKEAFFKALSAAASGHGLSLLTVCRHVSVVRQAGLAPTLDVDWQGLSEHSQKLLPDGVLIHLSMTHAKTMALVVVLFER